MDVVVVLPCVPATAMLYFRRASSASISARRMTGILRRSASRISGLSSRTAEDVTTTWAVADVLGGVRIEDRRAVPLRAIR